LAHQTLLDDLQFDTGVYSTTQLIAQAARLGLCSIGADRHGAVQTGRVLLPHRNDYVTLVGVPDAPLVAGINTAAAIISTRDDLSIHERRAARPANLRWRRTCSGARHWRARAVK
jgi:hypothetical protein